MSRRNSGSSRGCCSTPLVIFLIILGIIGGIASLGNKSDDKSKTSSISVSSESISTTASSSIASSSVSVSTPSASSESTDQNKSAQRSTPQQATPQPAATAISLANIPAYSGRPFIEINNNVPFFTDSDMTTTAFENYSSLDSLGRCGVAYANVCRDIMPTSPRGSIGSVKPSGWHTVKYAGIDGNYLYNRCHLIGYQLSAENANRRNLITGTRYLNIEGMLPFENLVADHVKESGGHVLYRVTPMFDGNNLLASGVLMEAKSVEDNGSSILFCVYCYNVQPGITINYANGDSSGPEYTGSTASKNAGTSNRTTTSQASGTGSDRMVWISATGNKYHSRNDCGNMNPNKARQITESKAIAEGKTKCSKCW